MFGLKNSIKSPFIKDIELEILEYLDEDQIKEIYKNTECEKVKCRCISLITWNYKHIKDDIGFF